MKRSDLPHDLGHSAICFSSGTLQKHCSSNCVLFIAQAFLLWGLPDKVRSAVNAMSFNQQGDLLLVGYASGALVLWDVPRARLNMTIVGEHRGAIVQAFILGQEALAVRHMKAITLDCTGRLLLHTFSFKPLLRRFAATSQVCFCLI